MAAELEYKESEWEKVGDWDIKYLVARNPATGKQVTAPVIVKPEDNEAEVRAKAETRLQELIEEYKINESINQTN